MVTTKKSDLLARRNHHHQTGLASNGSKVNKFLHVRSNKRRAYGTVNPVSYNEYDQTSGMFLVSIRP